MIVKTRHKGHLFTGVEVGAVDVRRYFPAGIHAIELHLDHLLIRCGLPTAFWHGHAEICDPRLTAWLESKNFNGRPGEPPIPLALIPSGKNCYRLKAISANARPAIGPVDLPVYPA